MKRWLLQLALAMSLLFNVFFVLGYMRAQSDAPDTTTPAQPADVSRVAAVLELDDDQRQAYQELTEDLRSRVQAFEGAISMRQRELMQALAQDEPDLVAIHEHIRELTTLQGERRAAGWGHLEELVGLLSPDQMRRLADRTPRRRRDRQCETDLLNRFDKDGDGALNTEERAAADEFVESMRNHHRERREERRKKWEALKQKFDANDDGELDEAERRELREHMEAQGWRPWPSRRERGGPREGDGRDRGGPNHESDGRKRGGPPPMGPPPERDLY